MIEINNRRYIGAKYKLLSNIEEVINNHINEKDYTFADLFAGTGVVAHSFAENGHPVIVNDIYTQTLLRTMLGLELVNIIPKKL